jgi:hypothetical protein
MRWQKYRNKRLQGFQERTDIGAGRTRILQQTRNK